MVVALPQALAVRSALALQSATKPAQAKELGLALDSELVKAVACSGAGTAPAEHGPPCNGMQLLWPAARLTSPPCAEPEGNKALTVR